MDYDDLFINWETFWTKEKTHGQWLYEPILAWGRGHACYAAKKEGKSLFVFSLVTYLSQRGDCIVIYLDYEMTDEDVWERLEDMGYGPETDLSRLRYALLPSIPPLDTEEGGDALMQIVAKEQANHPDMHIVVVVDTFGRAVESAEDKADTTRAFYRYTGLQLKKHGVTYIRLDHEGKTKGKEQRGSSAKADDVDIVWHLTRKDNGDLELHCDVARMSWVPTDIYLIRKFEPLSFDVRKEEIPPDVEILILNLDILDCPDTLSVRECRKVLSDNSIQAKGTTLQAAVRARKARPVGNVGNAPGSGYTRDTPLGIHPDDENP